MKHETILQIIQQKEIFNSSNEEVYKQYRKGVITYSEYINKQLDLFNQLATDTANLVIQDS